MWPPVSLSHWTLAFIQSTMTISLFKIPNITLDWSQTKAFLQHNHKDEHTVLSKEPTPCSAHWSIIIETQFPFPATVVLTSNQQNRWGDSRRYSFSPASATAREGQIESDQGLNCTSEDAFTGPWKGSTSLGLNLVLSVSWRNCYISVKPARLAESNLFYMISTFVLNLLPCKLYTLVYFLHLAPRDHTVWDRKFDRTTKNSDSCWIARFLLQESRTAKQCNLPEEILTFLRWVLMWLNWSPTFRTTLHLHQAHKREIFPFLSQAELLPAATTLLNLRTQTELITTEGCSANLSQELDCHWTAWLIRTTLGSFSHFTESLSFAMGSYWSHSRWKAYIKRATLYC